MTITVTLSDILVAATIVVPTSSGALYWAMRMSIRDAVKDLELKVSESFVSKASCLRIREECAAHRHELAEAAARAKR